MSLKLGRIAAARGSPEPEAKPARPTPARDSGRGPPPPRGSGWDAFVDWASGDAFYPSDEDIQLALRHWSGRATAEEDSQLPRP